MSLQACNRILASYGVTPSQRRSLSLVGLCLLGIVSLSLLLPDESAKNKSMTAIIVLGGGLTSEGLVPPHTQLRLNKAFELFKRDPEHTRIITLSGGTPHKPNPLNKNGFPIWESSAAAMKLVEMGVPADSVFEENFSLDTLGNAYFLRTVHIDPARYSRLAVITNDWHMDRTVALFDHVFSLPRTDGWMSRLCQHRRYNIEYIRVAPGIEDKEMLRVRIEKEQASLASFQSKVKHEFNSLLSLHDWIFTEHNAYATSRHKNNKNAVLSPELLKSY